MKEKYISRKGRVPFSLDDRVEYWSKKLASSSSKLSLDEMDYGVGFLVAVENGKPLELHKQSTAYKKGIYAGEIAKAKAFKQKFV